MNSRIRFSLGRIQLLLAFIGACLSTSSLNAQPAYSTNVLAYIDADFVAGSNLIANPLFSSDNTVSNLFRSVPNGTVFLPCAHGSNTFGPSNAFTLGSGWTSPTNAFIAPNCGFLILPSPMTLTFVGQPWSLFPGPWAPFSILPCLSYPQGESFSGWFTTITCGPCGIFECPPPPPADGTAVSLWDRQSQIYNSYFYIDGLGWFPSIPDVGLTDGVRISSPGEFGLRSPFGGSGTTPSSLSWVSLQNPRRAGTNFTFDWLATNNVDYFVFCSTNLNAVGWQQVQQGTVTPTNGVATVSVPGTNSHTYYRVLPQFGGSPVLLGGARGTASFGFQLYAPVATNYVVQRTLTLSSPIWQNVTNIAAGPSNIVGVVDQSATAATGYYRVSY